ncbi:ankyrin repeat protein [Fusarium avenaceum]|nr:ankyrin repeat protein [Fusarium avenaceum]
MLLHHRRDSMYLANHHCRIPWLLAAEQGREDVVRLLLDLGYTDVDTRDGRGRTALSLAAGAGQEGTVRLLLDYGHVNVNIRDGQGNKADWWAAEHLSENWRMVQRLQEAMKSL